MPVRSASAPEKLSLSPSAIEGTDSAAATAFGRMPVQPLRDTGPPVAGPDRDKAAVRQTRGQPAGIPDCLLELLEPWLSLADLARAASVCRQWYRTAGDHRLQTRAFMRLWSPLQRQRLYRALDPERLCRALVPWCTSLVPGSRRRQALEDCTGGRPSGWSVFFHLVRQLCEADGFSRQTISVGCGRDFFERQPLLCSPDGQWCVTLLAWRPEPGEIRKNRLILWQLGADCLVERLSVPALRPLCALEFGADSRTLTAFDDQGLQQRWQWDAGRQSWQAREERRLCPLRVLALASCQTGRYLAAAHSGCVQVFTADGDLGWRSQWLWGWPGSCRRPVAVRGAMHASAVHRLEFDRVGRQLVLSVQGEMFFAYRTGDVWQEQQCLRNDRGRALGSLVAAGYALEPASPVLALCVQLPLAAFRFLSGGDAAPLFHCRVTLLRPVAEQGWQAIAGRQGVQHNNERCPLVFSPDGRYLAFPEGQGGRDCRLCLLSAASQPPWSVPVFLPLAFLVPPVPEPRYLDLLTCLVRHIDFAVTSDCVAVGSLYESDSDKWRIVSVWRCEGPDWQRVASIQAGYRNLFVFAPDGRHCALACGLGASGSRISVWGPGSGGQYREKASLASAWPFRSLDFTPDATRLLITFDPPQYIPSCSAELRCLPLAPLALAGRQTS